MPAKKIRKSLTLQFNGKVTPEVVQRTLTEIYHMAGCTTCGLLGWDLRLQLGDPEIGALSGKLNTSGVQVVVNEQLGE